MAKVDYDKVKKQIEEKNSDINVDEEIQKLRNNLRNLSKEGAMLILANKQGIKVVTETKKATIKRIVDLKEGDDYTEIAGSVVETWAPRFYEICPSCAKRVSEINEVWKCQEHGIVSQTGD